MAGTVRHAKLDSPTARAKLKKGRAAHWQALALNNHLGYQRSKGTSAGRWLLRRHLGANKYRVIGLGLADDTDDPNGTTILNFDQAKARALSKIETGDTKITNLTVRQAFDRYVAFKESEGALVDDVLSRGSASYLA